jgi:hypothetical protein
MNADFKKQSGAVAARKAHNLEAEGSIPSSAIVLICAICGLILSGCDTVKKDAAAVDRNFRARVSAFSVPIGITLNQTGIIQIGVTPTWTYRDPAASGLKK